MCSWLFPENQQVLRYFQKYSKQKIRKIVKKLRYQERPRINPVFWLKYPKSARQMVFLKSQGNKTIQKYQTLNHFKQHFQANGWSSNSASMETGQKVHWINRLGKADFGCKLNLCLFIIKVFAILFLLFLYFSKFLFPNIFENISKMVGFLGKII